MGKINKHANLYDEFGTKIRSVKTTGKYKKVGLTDVTMEELEDMIDSYPEKGNKRGLDNMKMYLFNMYNTYGNPHEQELLERIKQYTDNKTKDTEVTDKLNDMVKNMNGDTDVDGNVSLNDGEYVDFEEVKEAA